MTSIKHIPEITYKEILALIPIVCVDIIIVANDKFLLTKRKNKPACGEWFFPGGRMLKNETFESAVKRKLKEETNLNTNTIKCLGVENTIFPDGPFGTSTHSVNIIFQITPNSLEFLQLDEQSEEFAWFSEIDEDWMPYIKKFLKLAGFKNT